MPTFRRESDALGDVLVPRNALYGAQTQRALENFQLSDRKIPVELIKAIAIIKLAYAYNAKIAGILKDTQVGRSGTNLWDTIMEAAKEVIEGKHDREFSLGVFQTGSGTSTNMNVNEVIANRAAEFLGVAKGKQLIHPNDHVNIGQSSNDVIPSAMNIAVVILLQQRLLPALEELHSTLQKKGETLSTIPLLGRTHLMDAVPISLGQVFSGYAHQVEQGRQLLNEIEQKLRENLPLGGTAVGTSVGKDPRLGFPAMEKIRELSGLHFRQTTHPFGTQSNMDPFVDLSGRLRTIAGSLGKIANDIRWMGSGPEGGLNELQLPALQPGSSIMPGKVNPVIPEAVLQACAQVEGLDHAVNAANRSESNFELCTAFPLIAANTIEMIHLLARAAEHLSRKCIAGLKAHEEHIRTTIERSSVLATILVPRIGYDAAVRIVQRAQQEKRTIRELAIEEGLLSTKEAETLLDPLRMTWPPTE